MAKLTSRQSKFVVEYLVDLKAGPAAIRAGYSPKTAETCGPALLRKPQVAAAVAKAQEARSIRTEISQDRVLEELALLAFSDVTQFEIGEDGSIRPTAAAPAGALRAISSIRYKITTDDQGRQVRDVELRLWDKPGPLKLAGRHVGLFPDRMELTGKDGQPLGSGLAKVVFMMPDNGRRVVPRGEGEDGDKKPKP